MKIVIAILKYFPHGGLQRDFMRIAEEANQRGHHVSAYTTSWQGNKPEWLDVHILNPFAFTNHRKSVLFYRALHQALQNDPCDVLLGMCRGPGLDVYFSGDDCFALNQRKKHSAWFCSLNLRIRTFTAMERAIFSPESKTEILYLVEQQKKQFADFYGTPDERHHLMPPGMNPECKRPANAENIRQTFRKNKNIPDDRLVLLCVGANLKLKGADRVIQSVASLPTDLQKNITLLLIGAQNSELEKYAQNIPADIRFEGVSDNVPLYYLAADLMIHPARSEATGTVLIEALSAGLPVICTALCGYSVFVREADAGYVLDGEFDQNQLNSAVKSFLSDKEHLKRLSCNALRYTAKTNLTGRSAAVVDFLEKFKKE